jgi:DNA-binding protein WhiA
MAEARLEHPEASLTELGELCDPKLSKSAVNHRMRRIQAVAAKIRGQ